MIIVFSCLLKSTEYLVERREVALILYFLACRALTFEQCEDNGVEFAMEFFLLKHIVEISGNELRFELEDATAECSKDDRVVAIEQGDAIDGTDFVEHDLPTFRCETAVGRGVFQIVGLVTNTEVKGCYGYDGGWEGLLTQGEPRLTIITEHGDIV